jgi:hypothetical protein
LIHISAAPPPFAASLRMERIDLLTARIALYHRYLREGADGDLARTYLWLIRQDEIELNAIVQNGKVETAADSDETVVPSERS